MRWESVGTSPSGNLFPLGRRAFDNRAKTRIEDFKLTNGCCDFETPKVTRADAVSRHRSAALGLYCGKRRERCLLVLRQNRKGDSGALMQRAATPS